LGLTLGYETSLNVEARQHVVCNVWVCRCLMRCENEGEGASNAKANLSAIGGIRVGS